MGETTLIDPEILRLMAIVDAQSDDVFMEVMATFPQNMRESLLSMSEFRMERYLRLLGERGERAAEKRRRWGI